MLAKNKIINKHAAVHYPTTTVGHRRFIIPVHAHKCNFFFISQITTDFGVRVKEKKFARNLVLFVVVAVARDCGGGTLEIIVATSGEGGRKLRVARPEIISPFYMRSDDDCATTTTTIRCVRRVVTFICGDDDGGN